MKKFTAIVLAAVMLLPLAACAGGGSQGGTVGLPNPIVFVDSAKDFEKLGISADAPSGARGAAYSIISDEIANVDFTMDGHSYTLRASKKDEDFSGLYGTEDEPRTLEGGAVLTPVKSGGQVWYRLSWENDGTHYILINNDGAAESDIIKVYGNY